MGTDIRAYTLIGTRVTLGSIRALTTKVRKPGCQCNIASDDEKFCSECGKQAWIEKLDQDVEEILDGMCTPLRLVFHIDWDNDQVYIGTNIGQIHYEDRVRSNCLVINNVEQGLEHITVPWNKILKLEEKFGPSGFTVQFGIWTVMDVNG